MPSATRSAVAPLYLLACLLLGGSAQGIWQNALLQVAGLVIIAWAAAFPPVEALPREARPLLLLAMAAVAVVAVQAVPLPPSFWAHGARARIAEGYELLGQAPPSLPVSLTPYASLAALLCMIPPLAMFCAIVRLRAYRPSWLAAALLTGTVAGILLGALQVVSRDSTSPWYLYRDTNIGAGVGFFANANHMASLLVIALPFAAAVAAAGKTRNIQRYSALLAVLAGLALLLIVGIALNGSIAGFALAVPVVAASALILMKPTRLLRRTLVLMAGVSVIAAVGLMAASSIGGTKVGQDASAAVDSREQIIETTGRAIADYLP
ncbi:MAG TPA: hypothetical protein VJT70_01965, partial [Sphingomicrobium sp.]|nr:hypothetical protein [Sphingomicrobium sp.]